MLEWKIKTGDEKLRRIIEDTKKNFDTWFNECWANRVSREVMLSPQSPLEHIYYKMCRPFEEVKEKLPNDAMEQCSSCGEMTDLWIETSFSFCNEYGCGLSLCPKCADILKGKIDEMLIRKGGVNARD